MLGILQYHVWALEESYFKQWAPIALSGHLDRFIKKVSLEDHKDRIQNLLELSFASAEVTPADAKLYYDIYGQIQVPIFKVGGKNIAVIPVIGPVTKYNDLCSLGMQTLQTLLARVNADSQVHGTVLLGDTPGGTVDGTPEFALAIKNSSKPVGWFGDNMTASAGLWLASQCAVIIGNKNNPTQFGSIGALRVVQNFSKMMEIGNMPQVDIVTAPQSSEKVKYDPTKPWKEDDLASMREEARPYATMIIDAVKSGRGDKLDTKAEGLFAGRMFDLNDAKRIGLIDSIGTLQTALNKVAELAREQKKQLPTSTNSTASASVNTIMKFPKLSALFSSEAWGKAVSAFTEDEAPLEAAEQKVATMESDLVKTTAEKIAAETRATSAEAKVTELNAQVSTLEGEKTTLTAKVAEQKTALDAKPTGQLTTVISDKKEEAQVNDDGSKKEGAERYMTSVDAQAAEIRKNNKDLSTVK
jgi:protease-4